MNELFGAEDAVPVQLRLQRRGSSRGGCSMNIWQSIDAPIRMLLRTLLAIGCAFAFVAV
jgi:hypothetical protein